MFIEMKIVGLKPGNQVAASGPRAEAPGQLNVFNDAVTNGKIA